MYIICSPSVGEEQADKFETVFAAVRYIQSDAQLKKEYLWYISHNKIIYMIFAKTKLKVIILICLRIHTEKKPTDSEQKKEKEKWW